MANSQYQLTKTHDSLTDMLVFGEVSVYDNTSKRKQSMKTVTKLSAAVALTAAMSVPVFADTGATHSPAEVVNTTNLSHTELSYAFGSTQNLQVMDMTGNEMSETEGATAPIILGGAALGMWAEHGISK